MPHAPDLSGHALDHRYELHALIGEGTFGRVYRGRDRRLDRPVAVKVIKPWWTEDPGWVATFEREAQLLARVSDPGIVQIFDVGNAPQGLYYVAELVEGENLADRLRRGPLATGEACAVAVALCRALARAHRQSIVHRDIKPANILLSSEGQVKVGDFGVARLAEGSTDGGAASVVGTPRYMAPEQGRGLPTTPATDVYSVGAVLYEMLAGVPPFVGATAVELALRHLQDPPPPLPADVPSTVAAVVQRALAKDPGARFADGAEMADALARVAPAGAVGAPLRRTRAAPPRPRSARHAPRRAPVGIGGGAGGGSEGGVGDAHGGGGIGGIPPAPVTPRRSRSRSRGAPPRRPGDTRVVADVSPRRNVNPPARRRSAAALISVVVLLVAMVAAAGLLRAPARTRVPRLVGLRRTAVLRAGRRAHLRVSFGHAWSAAGAGVAVSAAPGSGTRVAEGSRVRVVLSRGPAPVPVPGVVGQAVADATQSLRSLHLRPSVRDVPAPRRSPGTVVAQAPGASRRVPAGSTVALSVAETPAWHAVTSFRTGSSGAFRIIGAHWRIVYRMAFQGTCTWIFWCSGPNARVVNAATGRAVGGFGLSDGARQTQDLASGPGTYEVRVAPGGDAAAWSVEVDDLY